MADNFNETRPARSEVSEAVRELRKALMATQQEFAYRVPIAIRTVARWENEQPPRGPALVRLAQMAEAQGLEEISAIFLRALELHMASHSAAAPDLKPWLDGLEIAFRHRHRLGERWAALAGKIIEAVDFAASAAREISSREAPEFESVSSQLKSRLDACEDSD